MEVKQFRFTLNGVILDNEPTGWADAKINIKRDEDIKGLFIKYVTELGFWGNGYNIIQDSVTDNGACQTLTLLIEWDVGNGFETLFNGLIYPSDALEIDEQDRCMFKVEVEDASLSALISRRREVIVPVDPKTTLEGSAITSPTAQDIVFHNTGDGTDQRTVTGYFAFDYMQHILNYITDNQVTLVSDFLTVDYPQVEKWDIDYGAFATNDITMNFDTIFNTGLGFTEIWAGSEIATINSLVSEITNDQNGIDQYPFDYNMPYLTDNLSGTDQFDMSSLFPMSNIVIGGGANNSVTKLQDINTGMKELAICQGFEIRGASGNFDQFQMSFEQLFRELSNKFDLTFELTESAGVVTMRLEPTSFFYSQTQIVADIDNVPDINITYSKDFVYDNVQSEEESITDPTNALVDNQNPSATWIVTDTCSDSNLKLKNEFISNFNIINDVLMLGNDNYDEDFFLVETYDDSGTQRTTQYPYTQTSISPAVFNAYYYNAFMTVYRKIIYWFSSLGGDVRHERVTLTNDADPVIKKENVFEYPLLVNELKDIMNNPTRRIVFNGKDGWIKEINYSVLTSLTEFNLLSE